MKKTKFLFVSLGFSMCFAFGLHGLEKESRPADTRSVAVLEAREISHAEYVAIQEERALRCSEEHGEISEISTSEDGATARCLTSYYTTHGGIYHNPIAVSPLGDTVTLEDGSRWSVSFTDRYKTLDWMTSDFIVITPNHRWFSSYYFKLTNQATGVTVRVNLAKPPDYNARAAHWIVALDKNHRTLCLEDGSVWDISFWDSSLLKKWLENDTVIIGLEDGWFSSNPNILINATMMETNYVSGKCVQALPPVVVLP